MKPCDAPTRRADPNWRIRKTVFHGLRQNRPQGPYLRSRCSAQKRCKVTVDVVALQRQGYDQMSILPKVFKTDDTLARFRTLKVFGKCTPISFSHGKAGSIHQNEFKFPIRCSKGQGWRFPPEPAKRGIHYQA